MTPTNDDDLEAAVEDLRWFVKTPHVVLTDRAMPRLKNSISLVLAEYAALLPPAGDQGR